MKLLESGNSGHCNQTNNSFNYNLITNIGEIMTDQEKFDFLRSAFTDLFKKEMPDVTRLTPLQDLAQRATMAYRIVDTPTALPI